MPVKTVSSFLNRYRASWEFSSDFYDWAKGKSFEEVLDTCENGNWLEFLAVRLKVDTKKFALANLAIAQKVSHYVVDERSKRALEVARDFVNGNATEADLKTATAEAYTAYRETDRRTYGENWYLHQCAHDAAWRVAGSTSFQRFTNDVFYAYDSQHKTDTKRERMRETAGIFLEIVGDDMREAWKSLTESIG